MGLSEFVDKTPASDSSNDFTFQFPRPHSHLIANAYLVPLTIQQLLRHPRFVSLPSSRFWQYGLFPISIWLAMLAPLTQRWQPWDAGTQMNIGQSTMAITAVMKALELAFADAGMAYHRLPLDRTDSWPGKGQLSPEDSSSGTTTPQTNGHASTSTAQAQEDADELRQGPLAVAGWVLDAATNARGIGWGWGLPTSRLPAPHRNLMSLVRRLYTVHMISITAVAFIILCRNLQIGDSTSMYPAGTHVGVIGLQRLGIADFPGRAAAGDVLLTLAFGLCLVTSMELDKSLFTLVAFCIQTPLAFAFPSLVPAFDWRQWPPLFNHPHLAESITDLWANRWHTLFRRGFEVCAFRPGKYVARVFGASRLAQRAVGVAAAFLLSGLMHEFAVYNLAAPQPDGTPELSTFPYALFYFLAQPVGMFLLDPIFTRLLRGPRLRPLRIAYVWTFTLITARSFRIAYLEHRMDGVAPAVEHWSWKRWVVPGGALLPKGVLVSR